MKKVEMNWQWLLPITNFLASFDDNFLDNLSSTSPLYKISSLSFTKLERKNGLSLIKKEIEKITEAGE
jgi:hypothetical protein